MSLADWVSNSRQMYRRESASRATAYTLGQLWKGVKTRSLWHLYTVVDKRTVSVKWADQRVRYVCTDYWQFRRPSTLMGEGKVLEWLLGDVDEETVFWDVGAHYGTYTIVAALKGADTIAFEPLEENADALRCNAYLNDVDIEILTVALSDRTAERRFAETKSDATGRIDPTGQRAIVSRRGDDLTRRPNVVKIDTEGHGPAVLEGMRETLESVERIAIEVHDDTDVGEVRERLAEAELTVDEIDTNRSQTYVVGYR